MSKTRCIIVDDEPLAIEVLKSHVDKIDSLELVGTCSDAIEAFDLLQQKQVDLMFLDIHMPEMKGTDLVKTLKNPPAIVFTTAHREYAIESYDLNVLDYLLKPISFGRFLQTIEKYKQQNLTVDEVTIHKSNGDGEYIYLREKNVIHKVPVSEIIYIESFGDYLKLHTPDREIQSRCTISSIEKTLPGKKFIRIHRSFLIAMNYITSFSPVLVTVGKKEFPIGTSYRKKTFDKLNYNSFINKNMKTTKLIVLLTFVSITLSAQIVQWRGPNRDGHFPDTTLLQSWGEAGPELLMEVEGIGKGYSSPIIENGMIYTTGMIDTLDYLTAVNPDGTFKYQVTYGRSWYKSFPDTRSTPVIEENRIYTMAGMGDLSCFNKETGEKIWSVDIDKKFEPQYHTWGNSETPLIVDDLIVCSPAGDKTSVVAFNKYNGEQVWQSESLGGLRAYASATLYEHNGFRYILAVTASYLVALKPESGEIVWTYKFFDDEKWTYQDGLIWTNTPTFKDDEFFLSKGYNYDAVMIKMDSTGTSVSEKYKDHTFDNHHHGMILHDGYVYGSNWYNNRKGRWVCMKWDTGEIMYVNEWGSKGTVVMADGLLYCYNEKGSVGLVKPSPDGFDVISEFKITKGAGPHWAHPFIGEKKLLIRHGDALMVYNIAK